MSETARALARYAIATARMAPSMYNPASAMDQLLERIQPGLSSQVTAKASAMIRAGVLPQAALEQALTEAFAARVARSGVSGLGEVWQWSQEGRYPAAPGVYHAGARSRPGRWVSGLSGLGTVQPAGTAPPANRLEGVASLLNSIAALGTAIGNAVVGGIEQTGVREQQEYERRMGAAQTEREAAQAAALREAESILPGEVGGGIGGGTILLVVLGLAAASGAIYLIGKKK